MQVLVGILSHTKRQVSTELLRVIGLKGFFGIIDGKLGEVGKWSGRLFGRGRCLSPLALCVIGECSCVPLAWERKMFSMLAIVAGDCLLCCRMAVE